MKIRKILSFIIVLSIVVPAGYAAAHRVILFAWVENGIVYTESSFGSNTRARNCTITVSDEKGRVIKKGTTDQQGHYSFKVPEKIDSDLILQLNAGPGHQAKWRVSKKELLSNPSAQDIKKEMEQKDKLEAGPSVLQIAGGIAIIFLVAFGAKFIRRKTQAGA
jgi:nickel transport protein